MKESSNIILPEQWFDRFCYANFTETLQMHIFRQEIKQAENNWAHHFSWSMYFVSLWGKNFFSLLCRARFYPITNIILFNHLNNQNIYRCSITWFETLNLVYYYCSGGVFKFCTKTKFYQIWICTPLNFYAS